MLKKIFILQFLITYADVFSATKYPTRTKTIPVQLSNEELKPLNPSYPEIYDGIVETYIDTFFMTPDSKESHLLKIKGKTYVLKPKKYATGAIDNIVYEGEGGKVKNG